VRSIFQVFIGALLVALLLTNSARGQVFRVLHTFTNSPDGALPSASLVFDGIFLYGTTQNGGTLTNGTLFRIRPDGSDYARLINLSVDAGKNPYGSPTLNGSQLYFTTMSGGSSNNGTMVSIIGPGNTNSAYIWSAPKNFSTNEGFGCNGGLALSGGVLYGTMQGYPVPVAPPGRDNLFKIQTDGSSFTILTNLTGLNPQGGLTAGAGVLYGATERGGTGAGSIYCWDIASAKYTVIWSFTNGDGADPNGYLLLSGTNLFGTTWSGGAAGA
jgi:uncharacterized repeat protein (TIGR03803 family)